MNFLKKMNHESEPSENNEVSEISVNSAFKFLMAFNYTPQFESLHWDELSDDSEANGSHKVESVDTSCKLSNGNCINQNSNEASLSEMEFTDNQATTITQAQVIYDCNTLLCVNGKPTDIFRISELCRNFISILLSGFN